MTYNIGLDIGSNSVGWAITDPKTNKLVHVKGHNGIGVRLFKEGETAAARRRYRTTRRRLSRRKWRLRLLNKEFDEAITKVDPAFFARLKQSNVSPLDKHKEAQFNGNILFADDHFNDKKYHQQFPTIYHLRQALMTKKKKFDIRLVYLALHHIVKYRGHFLSEVPTSRFSSKKINLAKTFTNLNELFAQQNRTVRLKLDDLEKVENLLTDNSQTKSDRQRSVSKLIFETLADNKQQQKDDKKVIDNILKAILGLKAQFNVIFGNETEDPKAWNLNLASDDFDDKLADIQKKMNDEANGMLKDLTELYFSLNLTDILKDPETKQTANSLSQAMLNRYDDHKKHLKLLKKVINEAKDVEKGDALKETYRQYIKGKDGKPVNQDHFFKEVLKNLDDSSTANKIRRLIKIKYFMPKQRSKENAAIPHQLQQQELDKIIENQGQYYPWLQQLNPQAKRQSVAKYKLDELVTFRVPYYVGPMIQEDAENPNASFAWMQRKQTGEITPWTFDDTVDTVGSADRFIKRMTTTDEYLVGEPVLPKASLLYQQFVVLNELNKLRVNGQPITVKQKQYVFNHVYKKFKQVTLKKIGEALTARGDYVTVPKVTGTSDQETTNNALTTYLDLKRIFGEDVYESERFADCEKIVEWATIFEDKKIYQKKLDTIPWLTVAQKEQLARIRYTGWGRLSKKLLYQVTNQHGENIIGYLWNTNRNLMQTITEKDFKEPIADINGQDINQKGVEETLNDAYTSPQNKKAIRQVLKIVADIIKAMGGQVPQNIIMEFARGKSKKKNLTKQRSRQLEDIYKEVSQELLANKDVKKQLQAKIDAKADFNDRLYLYFLQGGIDLYTGDPLNIDSLSDYDIDHIIPQSFLINNSLDNRVLTSKVVNEKEKENQLPGEMYGSEMYHTWLTLKNAGILTNAKFKNLTLKKTNLNEDYFMARQLVETRQIIKLAANIMQERYKETHIVSVKANLTHEMRDKYNFYKVRNVNDYHHAFDAYLTAFVGNHLLQAYPKLKPLYVYGDFNKVNPKGLKSFNFLHKFEEEHTLNEAGKVQKDTNNLLGVLRDVYHFKKILVTKELETNQGRLFKETLFASPRKIKKRKLIKAKDNRPTDIYGGYSATTNVYMALVQKQKQNTHENRMMAVPLLELNQLMNQKHYSEKQAVEKIIARQLTDKKGKVQKHKILQHKVYLNQFVKEGKKAFTLASAAYENNAQQLVLNDHAMQTLANLNKASAKDLNGTFNNIIENASQFLKMYDINEVTKAKNNFSEISDAKEKVNVLNDLLKGLHVNAKITDLSAVGLNKYLGMFNKKAGQPLADTAKFIYQSPTGLFSNEVKVIDM